MFNMTRRYSKIGIFNVKVAPTKIRILSGLEEGILRNTVGHFGKWLPLRSKGKSAMALYLKIFFRACFCYIREIRRQTTCRTGQAFPWHLSRGNQETDYMQDEDGNVFDHGK